MASSSARDTNTKSQRLGKIDQCKILKQLRDDKKTELDKMHAAMQKSKEEVAALERKHHEVSAELRSTTDSTDFADVEDVLVSLPVEVQNRPSMSETKTSISVPPSIVGMILGAANQARQLENRNEMLQVMYAESGITIAQLTTQLAESTAKEGAMEQRIQELTLSVNDLRVKLEQFQTAHPNVVDVISEHRRQDQNFSVQSSSGTDDTSLDMASTDRAQLAAKCRELKQRIIQLNNYNHRWDEICKNLMTEIEDAKRKLEEKVTAQTAPSDKHQPLSHWTALICRLVEELEQKVVDLETKLQSHEAVDRQTEVYISDENIAMKYQMEEYQEKIAEVESRLSREKSNKESLEQQWKTIYEQLQKAHKDKDDWQAKHAALCMSLKQANIDQQLIQSHLQANAPLTASNNPVASPSKPSYDEQRFSEKLQTTSQGQSGKQSRGILEEDGFSYGSSYSVT